MEIELEKLSKQELLMLIQKNKKFISIKEEKIKAQDTLIQHKDSIITQQKYLIAKYRRMLFGQSKESFKKSPHEGQQLSIDYQDLDLKTKPVKEERPEKDEVQNVRKKSQHQGRNPLPKDLPVREVIIEPKEDTTGLKKIGEERTEILEYIPAHFLKIILIRPKYEKINQDGVLIAPMPNRPIHKCMAGNSLLSSILINKYVDHLPLYRQRQIFKRANIQIASSTINSWVSQMGKLLKPLYDGMLEVIKKDGYLQADETPIKVLDKDKKGKTHQGYFWVYRSPLKRMVVFDYQKGRNKEAPKEILDQFSGYLQTDGYSVYNQYKNKNEVSHLACWAHVRRYFEKALEQDSQRAEQAMFEIQKLYAIEREIAELSADQKKAIRLDKSLPIINALGKWIAEENTKVLPKSLIGKAFQYSSQLWDSLLTYLYDGHLLIDNNLIENSIRPNALGRKNYLFAGSHQGAKRSAMFYSFFGTCKAHNIDPQKWLTTVLERINETSPEEIYTLFPQNMKLD